MKRILITYSTWTGSTREVAEFISETLQKAGNQTVLQNVKNVAAISEFDGIVVGTPIHASRVTNQFLRFLKRHVNELKHKPLALFVVCANMNDDTEENRIETLAWVNNALQKLGDFNPVKIGLFAGAALTQTEEFHHQNIFIKKITQAMQNNLIQEHGKSDFRDWDKITHWVYELNQLISGLV